MKAESPNYKMMKPVNYNSLPATSQNGICMVSGVANSTGSLLAITTVAPQKITPISTSQVIKMNDYQVILSNGSLPLKSQDTGTRNNTCSSLLPTLNNQSDATLMFTNQRISVASSGSINVLNHNQFSTIVIKDGSSSVTKTTTTNDGVLNQSSSSINRSCINAMKTAKVKKKPTQIKKIMLKPASSLLSQTALDYRNKDNSKEEVIFPSSVLSNTVFEMNASSTDNLKRGTMVKGCVEVGRTTVVTSTVQSMPTPSITTVTPQCNVSSSYVNNLANRSRGSDSSVSSFAMKSGVFQNLHGGNESQSNVPHDAPVINLNGNSTGNTGILVATNTSLNNQGHVLRLDCNPSMNGKCSAQTNLSVTNIQMPCESGRTSDNNSQNQGTNHPDLLRADDFNRDQAENIFPSDIDHHEEPHTQEYTDNLLSQLSSSRVLPNMSSSQVSSVLNALTPTKKSDLIGSNTHSNAKSNQESVKCEPPEFVKIESLHLPNNPRIKPTTKAPELKYRSCELNKHTCYRCMNCMFISLKPGSVGKHWIDKHQNLRSEVLDKPILKRPLRCLGCSNVFYSKYPLQIHLLCDHNVTTSEVHDLIAATISANRSKREFKRQANAKMVNTSKASSKQSESCDAVLVEDSSSLNGTNITSVTQSLITVVSNSSFVEEKHISGDAKVDDEKHSSSQESSLLSTPSFDLFFDVPVPNEEEVKSVTEYKSCGDSVKKVIRGKQCRVKAKTKIGRDRLRLTDNGEVMNKFRCMVEFCGVRVSSVKNINYHLRCHKAESALLFCPECNLSAVTWNNLTSHLWREHKIDIDLYSCVHCSYKSNSFSKLINNHIKIHSDLRAFSCDQCGKAFKTLKQLRNHKAIHRNRRKYMTDGLKTGGSDDLNLANYSSNYVCDVCSRSFVDARILKHHTLNVHNKARPYHCTFCSHTASSKGSLRMHIRQHTGEKPFGCSECEYVTSDHNSLRRHKMRHSGKRPYQCPYCVYNCIQSTTYKAHLKNKHPGMDEGLMFSCPVCSFRTIKKDNYLAHKAEHDLGGDPRGRRKKSLPSSETVQENNNIPEEEDIILIVPDSMPN